MHEDYICDVFFMEDQLIASPSLLTIISIVHPVVSSRIIVSFQPIELELHQTSNTFEQMRWRRI